MANQETPVAPPAYGSTGKRALMSMLQHFPIFANAPAVDNSNLTVPTTMQDLETSRTVSMEKDLGKSAAP